MTSAATWNLDTSCSPWIIFAASPHAGKSSRILRRRLRTWTSFWRPPRRSPRRGSGETQVRVTGERETATRAELLRLTRPANIAGMPAVSIPCGFTRAGLPVGLQLMGPRWSEARLLAIAQAYEEATDWHNRHPDLA